MVIRNSGYDFSYIYDIENMPGEESPTRPTGFDDESKINFTEETTLWRYTSIGKLRNIIAPKEASQGELFFYKAQKFKDEDKYEGTIPDLALESIKNLYKTLHQSADNTSTERWVKNHNQVSEKMRNLTYINCWRYGEQESDLMWRKFTSPDSGVVIKSNAKDFAESFEEWPGCLYIDETRYVHREFDNTHFNRITPFFIKRSEYRGEQELRAVITLSNKSVKKQIKPSEYPKPVDDDLICAEVDINKLISKIVVHPDNQLLKAVVEDILQMADLDVPVEESSL